MELTKSSVTYAHAKLKIDDYWNRGITGKGVKLAIFDGGLGNHDALPEVSGGYACGRHKSYLVDSSHAIHCAGIALGRNIQNGKPAGIAPDASLYVIRMYNASAEARVKSYIEAIEYAIEEGIDAISLALPMLENAYRYLEGSYSTHGAPKHLRIRLRDAFLQAYKNGIIIFVSAGNRNDGTGEDNIEFGDLLPKMPNAVTVANLTINNDRFSTSGVGKWVDISGYGTSITSTTLNNEYVTSTGTSMSTPQIAGVFALYKQLFSDLSNQEVLEKVFENCERVPGLNSEQQGRGVPLPPSELYELPTLENAVNQFRRYTDYTWQATETYAKIDGEWIETEAMGRNGE